MKLYETDKFYLRPFTKEDITKNYLAWFMDQEVTKHTSHGLVRYTHEMSIEFLDNAEKNGDVIWAIIAKDIKIYLPTINEVSQGMCRQDRRVYTHIGNIALQNFNMINRTAEFAGILGEKEYWSKGIGTEAIRFLFEHGFNKMNLNRIWLGTVSTNTGMRSIAGKLGMTNEGILRNHVFLNGEYTDVYQFGIMRDEWNKK